MKNIMDLGVFIFENVRVGQDGYFLLFIDGFCVRIMLFPKKRPEDCRDFE